jgi:hypothetical protein
MNGRLYAFAKKASGLAGSLHLIEQEQWLRRERKTITSSLKDQFVPLSKLAAN